MGKKILGPMTELESNNYWNLFLTIFWEPEECFSGASEPKRKNDHYNSLMEYSKQRVFMLPTKL